MQPVFTFLPQLSGVPLLTRNDMSGQVAGWKPVAPAA
jgi:hypothetical protein